jgi:asparagine synthetase B (glutamine-hydrolysing)
MCGIFCHIYRSNTGVNCQDHDCKLLASLSPLLSSRGPDHSGEILLNASGDLALHFYSSVLWLRGDVMQPQPATTKDDGHVLCWNGDVFGGDLDGEDDESDTSALFKRLKALPDDANVPAVMCSVEGPHAFVYYRAETNRIWFGRDYIGRHSLLMSANGDKDQFVLTSVTDPTALPCVEVPACGVYEGRLDQLGRPGWITLHKWHQDQKLPQSLDHKFIPHEKWLKTKRTIFSNGQNIREDEWVEKAILEEWPAAKIMKQFQDCHGHLVRQLEFVLKESVRKRVTRQPNRCKGCISDKKEFDGGKNCSHAKVGVLFSGGIDSVVVTALADQILPPDEQIDLINVAFAKSSEIGENGSYDGVPDRLTAVQAIKELRKLNPERKYNFVAVNVPKEELAEERINRVAKLLHPHDTVLDDSIGASKFDVKQIKY